MAEKLLKADKIEVGCEFVWVCDENDGCGGESCMDVEVVVGNEPIMLELIDESEGCGSNIELENGRSISEIDELKFGTGLPIFVRNFLGRRVGCGEFCESRFCSGSTVRSAGKEDIVIPIEGKVDIENEESSDDSSSLFLLDGGRGGAEETVGDVRTNEDFMASSASIFFHSCVQKSIVKCRYHYF